MGEIELSDIIKLITATAVAFWVYRLSERHEDALEKHFEVMEFCGQTYLKLDREEKHFSTRLIALLRFIKQRHFGVICEQKEPISVILPMEAFLRLKAIEEHLDDLEIAQIIEERLGNRKKSDPHPMMDFEHFREGVYQEAKKRAIKREPTSLATFLWEDYLKPLGLRPQDVASSIRISNEQMQDILENHAPIDANISERLGVYFGVDATFFLKVDQAYQSYTTNKGVHHG